MIGQFASPGSNRRPLSNQTTNPSTSNLTQPATPRAHHHHRQNDREALRHCRGPPRRCHPDRRPQLHHLVCPPYEICFPRPRAARSASPRANRVAGEAVKGGPSTPSEQAAALAGTAEKKIGPYKTFKGASPRPSGPELHNLGPNTTRRAQLTKLPSQRSRPRRT